MGYFSGRQYRAVVLWSDKTVRPRGVKMIKLFKTSRSRREHAALAAAYDLNLRLREEYPARLALAWAMMLIFGGLPAAAKDPGKEAYMIRVLACEGPDAKMEVYLPQSVVSRTLNNSVIGYYALDLTDANKGKPLEPVRIRLSPDKQTVIVEQYTRGAPPTRIPVAGGTVDFDNRFGTAAKCGAFQVTE
jgi:hypothetical protein